MVRKIKNILIKLIKFIIKKNQMLSLAQELIKTD